MATKLNVTSATLIAKNTPVPSKVTSPAALRASKQPYSQPLARDLENLSQTVNSLHSVLSKNAPSISQILLKDSDTGQVVAAFGDFTYDGEYYTNFLNELHVGDPLGNGDPQNALFNANKDGSVTLGESGWLDVLDAFGGEAAWLGTQNDTFAITNAVNNGSGLIRLTVPGHSLGTGNQVRVQKVGGVGSTPVDSGNFVSNATGMFTVTRVDGNTVDLQNSVFAGSYSGGGVIDRLLPVSSVADNGSGLARVVTSVAHGYENGDQVSLSGTNADGQWIITVIDSVTFDLRSSHFSGSYDGTGTVLRYFAGVLAQSFAIGKSFADYNLRQFADGSLTIKNAAITLSNSGNTILIDPTGPSIKILPAAGGSIVIDPDGIKVTSPGGNEVTLSASSGDISQTGSLVNAGGATEDIQPFPTGPTLHFVNGVYTGHS